jgi:prevent-host-death family protein
MMSTFTIHAAKTNLSKLLARVEAGEEIVIARGKTPIARLTPSMHRRRSVNLARSRTS